MRIRYVKEGGVEVDLPDASARRLIASGQAEAVDPDEATEPDPTSERPPRKTAAKKTGRRSK